MALINCPECNKEISDTCDKCPHCGYVLKKTSSIQKTETKILEVNEEDVSSTINDMAYFGWNVLSSQKIDYTTTYRTGGGNANSGYRYVWHSDRTSYYSITFQRSANLRNYSELNSLYTKYENAKETYEKTFTKTRNMHYEAAVTLIIVSIICIVGGFIAFIPTAGGPYVAIPIAILIMFSLWLVGGIFSYKKHSKIKEAEEKATKKARSEAFDEKQKILEKAKSLLDEN